MPSNNLTTAELFLISTLFDLYLYVLVIRLLLAFTKANYFNPITQFIIKLTQPLVGPVRRVVPNYRNIEFATLIWIIVFEMIKISLIGLIVSNIPNLVFILILALISTLKLILNAFFYAILIQAILSWIQPGYSPVSQLLEQITDPIMAPLRRLIPPIGGFDITPIPALIILQLLLILLP